MDVEEIRKEYEGFLDRWQEMTAPSGFDTYLAGFCHGESESQAEVERYRKAIEGVYSYCGDDEEFCHNLDKTLTDTQEEQS